MQAVRVIGEGGELDKLVELWHELPTGNDDAANAGKNGEKERVILEHSLHPGPTLVVGKEDADHLRRFYQEDGRVEKVGKEGCCPERIHLAHEVVLATAGSGVNLLGLGLFEKLGNLLELLRAHGFGRNVHGKSHAGNVNGCGGGGRGQEGQE